MGSGVVFGQRSITWDAGPRKRPPDPFRSHRRKRGIRRRGVAQPLGVHLPSVSHPIPKQYPPVHSNVPGLDLPLVARFSVSPNQWGHLEFTAEILDESGNATSADLGHTYRKLLCNAFDLAVIHAHVGGRFPHFESHEGVFESLDDRKKNNLLTVIRQHADLGIQIIITLIDSDFPNRERRDERVFDDDKIILSLHDENEQGRPFKTKAW